ncbi:S-layer homology domain-containing protein [Intestinimonas timonensis]|uniref:S-layer homology domain-containing protein n=1 Tax=Intestinimonas timonensis TaxID=1689270 RepID=UPI00102FBB33|nr:S-layer homology domain-containing protein [Intestinimonas timonensis]
MKRTICAWLLVLGLAVGTAVPASAAAFTDVASDAWYAQAVNEVSAAGIMNGTTTSTFSPDEQVTRGMVMAVLWRLAGSPAPSAPSTFPDVEDWYYYADAVAWAQQVGIASGLGDGTFGGGNIVTREQLSVFLYRYSQYAGQELANGVLDLYNDVYSVHTWAKEGMAHAVGAGLITGTDEGNLEPAGPATRAQLAVILQRLMTPAVG